VQRDGRLPALIATEPSFDAKWVERLGVDPELLLLQRPLHAEEAFEMLHDLVYENLVDFIVLDSLGALSSASESTDEGEKQKDFKKKAFGISGTVTAGLNAVMPRLWRNNIGLLILNQQRQDTKSRTSPGMGMQYDSPGGEALHHDAVMRIQLKPGKNRYLDKIDGEEVLAGRELVCQFKKNKVAMNAKAARFDFFYLPTAKYDNKLGVDEVEDIIRTCKVSGVIQGAAYLEHHSFPKGKVHGKPGLAKLLQDQPQIKDVLRAEVMDTMRVEQAAVDWSAKSDPPKLEVVSND
jgi:recombination protein RecA